MMRMKGVLTGININEISPTKTPENNIVDFKGTVFENKSFGT